VVDIFFVGKLGSTAIATVGLTEAMLSMVYALAMGLSTAAAAMISRRVGEKDLDEAATTAVQVMLAALVGALALGGSRGRRRGAGISLHRDHVAGALRSSCSS
jgi:Na+-driven multidrug efflux pump